MNELAFHAKDVCKRVKTGLFGSRMALEGVNLQVARGEICGVLGPAGAGKSYLMNIAAGFQKLSSGSLRLFGEPVESKAIRKRVAFVPEIPALFTHFTVQSFLELMGQLSGLDKAVVNQQIAELTEALRLQDILETKCSHLSLSQSKEVELAQALLGKPCLLLLDEPLSGLDPVARNKVVALLRKYHIEDKGTVLLTSHLVSEVEGVCEHVCVMGDGRILADRTLNDWLQIEMVEIMGKGRRFAALDEIDNAVDSVVMRKDGFSVFVKTEKEAQSIMAYLAEKGGVSLEVIHHSQGLEDVYNDLLRTL